MLLTLPYNLGGYGIAAPELNSKIIFSEEARRTADRSYYLCDLFWPELDCAVEYDSDQFHTGADRIARDSKRRNSLSAVGITVVTVTNRQLQSISEFDKVARIISQHTDRRLQYKSPKFNEKRLELRRQIL
jgi:very-short-patch-repair endonuclease